MAANIRFVYSEHTVDPLLTQPFYNLRRETCQDVPLLIGRLSIWLRL